MVYVSYNLKKCDFQVFASIFMHALCKITLHISVRNCVLLKSEGKFTCAIVSFDHEDFITLFNL